MFRTPGLMAPAGPVYGTAEATDVKAPMGGGTISGINPKTGLRQSVSYTKENMPLPYGVTDTSTPEEKAADAARRVGWKQQSAEIDTRMAAKEEAAARSLNNMVNQQQLNAANYDLRQGLRNHDVAAVAAASQTIDQINKAQNRQAATDAKAQETAASMANAKLAAETHRYGYDKGCVELCIQLILVSLAMKLNKN